MQISFAGIVVCNKMIIAKSAVTVSIFLQHFAVISSLLLDQQPTSASKKTFYVCAFLLMILPLFLLQVKYMHQLLNHSKIDLIILPNIFMSAKIPTDKHLIVNAIVIVTTFPFNQ